MLFEFILLAEAYLPLHALVESYHYFVVVVGLARLNDPGDRAGGSVATTRASHAGQVKGDDPDKKGYPDPLGWWLVVRLQPQPELSWWCSFTIKYTILTELLCYLTTHT